MIFHFEDTFINLKAKYNNDSNKTKHQWNKINNIISSSLDILIKQ